MTRAEQANPLALLTDLATLRIETELKIVDAIVEARRVHAEWSDIGRALGVSKQAAHSRYAAKVNARRRELYPPAPFRVTHR